MNTQEHIIVECPPYGAFKVAATSEFIRWRATSFHTKEPTTIQWLQTLEKDSILIDVGANIGIYTVPAALFHVKKVIAVEPEIKSYNELIKNIEINGIDEVVEALPLAISTEFENCISNLYLTSDEPGSSCHQVGRNQNYLLNPSDQERKRRSIYCISLSSIVQKVRDEHPKSPIHIKVDVDGIEEDVCQSLFDSRTLNYVNTLQVELNPAIPQHGSLIKRLQDHGFSYSKLQVTTACRKSGSFEGFAEYVFRRYITRGLASNLPESVRSRYYFVNDENDLSDISGCILGSGLNHTSVNNPFSSTHNPALISTSPPALVLPRLIHSSDCLKIFTSLGQCIEDSKDFGFESNSGFNKDENRRAISTEKLLHVDRPYVNQLAQQFSNIEIPRSILKKSMPLLKSYLGIEEKEPFIPGLKLTVRLRHFLDLQGFYLCGHHDSPDTLLALICPLTPSSTTTSFFNTAPETAARFKSPKSSRFESQFRAGHFYEELPSDDGIYRVVNANGETLYCSHVHSARLQHGDTLVIPNLRSKAFSKPDANNLDSLNRFAHGVFPPIPDLLRPVLLADYIVSKQKDKDTYSTLFETRSDSSFHIHLCPLSDLLK
ncbi:FkbM family methyltransferase [Synechococcus sp. LTW-R]|uniref:FkbM family methyltransferase n=1 Tax=Synechococcus sp. LTW-R TaxID=2751170 RepID=UPI001623C3AD|nr:FkbM family methyltransferase [Synechococcus sp. LTW-R]QNG30680.1 FkbM family methyltransferase [Synechococcus sp. LTW-R]